MTEKQRFPVYDNRELSWLKFNKRVLEQAENDTVPIMERMFFLSVFSSNLDEFYRVRVGALTTRMLSDDSQRDSKTRLRPSEQLTRIFDITKNLISQRDKTFSLDINLLSQHGVTMRSITGLTPEQYSFLDMYFDTSIKPFCTTALLENIQNLYFFKNSRLYITALLKTTDEKLIGTVSLTDKCERVIFLPDSGDFVLSEDVALHFVSRLFDGYDVLEKSIIRVTRSAAADVDSAYDANEPLCESMEKLITERKHFPPVRLQLKNNISERFLSALARLNGLTEKSVFVENSPLDMSFIEILRNRLKDNKKLFYSPFSPGTSKNISGSESICEQVLKKDLLLSYPYESIDTFIKLLEEAAADDRTESIKITLYRVAKHSKIVNALCVAAKNGKSVTACVELRARFDEEHNIMQARKLKNAGCNVIFGQKGFKVHSKLCLITMRTEQGLLHITQIGTGNYNEKTAKSYTDFSLMTADKRIARDTQTVFNSLENGNLPPAQEFLMVSPYGLQSRIISFIDEEISYAQAGSDGYLGFKMNGLTDKTIIDKLVIASQAGVKIDLIVRGICCILPKIENFTENVHVVSIVGRFLEHSRIYIFGKNTRQKIYISSADLMTRNTCRRIEAAVPLFDTEVKKTVYDYFCIQMQDNVNASEMYANGKYEHLHDSVNRINSQDKFVSQSALVQEIKHMSEAPPAEKNNLHEAYTQTEQTPKKKKGFFSWLASLFKRKK